MEPNKLFTQEELDEMGTGFNQLALEALENGDTEKAKYWIQKNEETKYAFHDLYMHWVSDLLGKIYDRLGLKEYMEILKSTVKHWAEPYYHKKKDLIDSEGLKSFINLNADLWRQHCGEFTVEEDDEKITFKHYPCGSGGRLINEGAFDGESGYRRIKEAGPHTWGKENIPIYCTHCPQAHQILAIEDLGKGHQLWVHDYDAPFPQKPGDPCIHHIYKDPDKIPEKYYEYIGMEDK